MTHTFGARSSSLSWLLLKLKLDSKWLKFHCSLIKLCTKLNFASAVALRQNRYFYFYTRVRTRFSTALALQWNWEIDKIYGATAIHDNNFFDTVHRCINAEPNYRVVSKRKDLKSTLAFLVGLDLGTMVWCCHWRSHHHHHCPIKKVTFRAQCGP